MTGAFPYGFERDSTIAELHDRFDALEPGAGSDEERSVAGRLRTVRAHGKLAFADLEDQTGRIQLFARLDILGEEGLAGFVDLGVGDIVGTTGEIVKTRRGELSVMVKSTSLLAPCQRPMPDNWHGLSDVETRYRQRYLDLLFNPSARRALEARSVANATIRSFLSERAFIEVETPLLQSIPSGAVARPFKTHHNALDLDLYLRVAPELYLKRLLIGGLERVFELNRSFRNEGISTQHNPEFSMLEAYEAFVDYEVTMDLVEELVRAIAGAVTGGLEFESAEGPIDLAPKFRRTTIFEVIAERTGSDLSAAWESGDQAVLVKSAKHAGVEVDAAWSQGKLLLEIFEAAGERSLIQPTFVMGFPKDVSPLAKDHRDVPGFTEHADLIIGGLEIAPIYSELNDPDEQKRRFEQQASVQASSGAEALIPDGDFIEALAYGMPPAGGFGLGVDRLLMLLLGLPSIREVVMFPTLRPER